MGAQGEVTFEKVFCSRKGGWASAMTEYASLAILTLSPPTLHRIKLPNWLLNWFSVQSELS